MPLVRTRCNLIRGDLRLRMAAEGPQSKEMLTKKIALILHGVKSHSAVIWGHPPFGYLSSLPSIVYRVCEGLIWGDTPRLSYRFMVTCH